MIVSPDQSRPVRSVRDMARPARSNALQPGVPELGNPNKPKWRKKMKLEITPGAAIKALTGMIVEPPQDWELAHPSMVHP